MTIREPEVTHLLPAGVPSGMPVAMYEKRFSDIAFAYHNPENIYKNTLMYTVYSYESGNPSQRGNLNWGLTILEPVLVNGECNMTRGHFHVDRNCAEIYLGLGGEGLLLLMDESGNMTAERMFNGSVHHIDGKFAHRVVNTGDSRLLVGACWPSTAGHDYAATEKTPFCYRVYRTENGIEIKKNV